MGCCIFKSGKEQIPKENTNFFDYEAIDINGKLVKMSEYKDKKVILVVNVACKCGLTSVQYSGLVKLYQKYKDQGLEILGFPCNQFLSQEPWDEPKIQDFIKEKFGATFPLFQKVEVNGNNPHPIYKFLRTNSELYDQGTQKSKQIPWNFGKFIVNKQGQVSGFYKPTLKPQQLEEIVKNLIELS